MALDVSLAYPIIAAIIICIESIALRKMMKDEKDGWAATAANELVGTVMLLAAIAFVGVDFFAPSHFDFSAVPLSAWLAMGCSALIFSVSTYTGYRMYSFVGASEGRTISQLTGPLAAIMALVVFGEKLSLFAAGGIVLVIAGVAFATGFAKMHPLKNEGVRLALITVVLWSCTSLFDKYAINYFPPLVYSLPLFVAPLILSLAIVARKNPAHILQAVAKHKKMAFVIGLANIASYFFVLMAYRMLPLSIASPLIGVNVAMTVLAGALFLGEKEGLWQKIAGAIIVIAGIAMIGA